MGVHVQLGATEVARRAGVAFTLRVRIRVDNVTATYSTLHRTGRTSVTFTCCYVTHYLHAMQ
jgi:hypothetical protein